MRRAVLGYGVPSRKSGTWPLAARTADSLPTSMPKQKDVDCLLQQKNVDESVEHLQQLG